MLVFYRLVNIEFRIFRCRSSLYPKIRRWLITWETVDIDRWWLKPTTNGYLSCQVQLIWSLVRGRLTDRNLYCSHKPPPQQWRTSAGLSWWAKLAVLWHTQLCYAMLSIVSCCSIIFLVWYGMEWYGMVWYGVVWYGMVSSSLVRIIDPQPWQRVRLGVHSFTF